MIVAPELGSTVETEGFVTVEGVLSRTAVDQLLVPLEHIGDTRSVRKRGGIFALRNLLDVSPEVRELAHSEAVRALVEPVLGEGFFPVRGILFDKIPDANWKVPWHQDVTIAVQERVEAEGFGPWSMKADVLHVQPPAEVLGHMIPCGSTSTTAGRRTVRCASSQARTCTVAYPKRRSRRCVSRHRSRYAL